MKPIPRYRYDANKLKQGLRPYLIEALNKASDEMLKRMKIHVHDVTYRGRTGKGAPGDPQWRDEIDRDLHKIYAAFTDDFLEVGVGADYSDDFYGMIRAMVVAYGSGSKAGNPPIQAGPLGRKVFNDSLTDRDDSRVDDQYDLPEEFNHEGNDFVAKAVKETVAAFEDIVQQVLRTVPDHVYSDALVRY